MGGLAVDLVPLRVQGGQVVTDLAEDGAGGGRGDGAIGGDVQPQSGAVGADRGAQRRGVAQPHHGMGGEVGEAAVPQGGVRVHQEGLVVALVDHLDQGGADQRQVLAGAVVLGLQEELGADLHVPAGVAE